MSRKWGFLLVAIVIVFGVLIAVWTRRSRSVIQPYRNSEAVTEKFARGLPESSAVKKIVIEGSTGPNQLVRAVRSSQTAPLATQIAVWLKSGVLVHLNVPGHQVGTGRYAVQLVLRSHRAVTISPAVSSIDPNGARTRPIRNVVVYEMSTGRTVYLRDAPIYHWLVERKWRADLRH